MQPYYDDGQVQLWHGDCRDLTPWLTADILITDPPYGRAWTQGAYASTKTRSDCRNRDTASTKRAGIQGDASTETRDEALCLWGDRPGVLFGDLMLPPPAGTRQVAIYRKAANAGLFGAVGGWRRDAEALYLTGTWPKVDGLRSSIVATGVLVAGGQHGPAGRHSHPHAKPLDVMEQLIAACPPGVIADPFAGSGSTLVAARNLGRRAIGVEIEERYCETAARRLAQIALPLHP